MFFLENYVNSLREVLNTREGRREAMYQCLVVLMIWDRVMDSDWRFFQNIFFGIVSVIAIAIFALGVFWLAQWSLAKWK